MIRVVINLKNSEKKWLRKQALLRRISMTELVREALSYYRQKIETEKNSDIKDLLVQTAGIWTKGDGLEYQKKIRGE